MPAKQPVQASAGVNSQINYQGRLLTASGAVVPDGNYNFEFKIYQDGDGTVAGDTAGAPAGTLLWTEDWYNTASRGIVVRNGYFSVQLGTYSALSAVNFNSNTIFLSVNIGGTTVSTPTLDGEMLPMKRLASSPYALNSGQLGGLTSSQFLQVGVGGTIQGDSSTNTAIALNKTGTGTILDLQKGGADVQLINSNGQTLFRPTTDSQTALQVQKAGTTTTVFTVDTTNSRIGINTATPLYTVDAVGQINSSTALSVAGTSVCTSSGCVVNPTSGILNQSSQQGSANFNIAGQGSAGILQAYSALNELTTNGGTYLGYNRLLFANTTAAQNIEVNNSNGILRFFNPSQAEAVLDVDTNNTTNIVSNPGFEAGTTNWIQDGTGTVAISQNSVKTNAYTGLSSMNVSTQATSGQGAKTSTFTTPLTSTTAYTLSFYAKLASGTMTSLVAGRADNGATETGCTLNSTTLSTSGFQHYSCTFTTGTVSGSPYIYIKQNDAVARTIYIDSVQLQAGSSATPYYVGGIQLSGVLNSPVAIQTASDSTSAFQVQNAAGTSNLLIADTLDGRVGIGTAAPAYPLDVVGQINSSTGLSVGGTTVCTSAGCTVNASTAIQNTTTPQAANFSIVGTSSTLTTAVIQANTGCTTGSCEILDVNRYDGSAAINIDGGGNVEIGGTLFVDSGQILNGAGSNTTLNVVTAGLSSSSATGNITVATGGNSGAGASGNAQISTGAASTGTSGIVSIDSGVGAGGNGSIYVGSANAPQVILGNYTNSDVIVRSSSATSPALSILNSNGTTALEVRAGGAGQGNAFVGLFAGQYNNFGGGDTGLGAYALGSNNGGDNNTATGNDALYHNVGGNDNTATGNNALDSNVGGNNNVALGFKALQSNVNASNNTAIGTNSLAYNTTTTTNTALGSSAYSNFTPNAGAALTVSAVTTGSNGTNQFTVSAHGYQVGSNVCFQVSSTGTMPAPLLAATTYCFNVTDANNFSYQGTITGAGTGTIKLIPNTQYTDSTAIGYNSAVTASNQVSLGDSSLLQVTTTGGINQTNGANANVLAGLLTANNGLVVTDNQTATSGSVDGIFSNINVTPVATSTATFRAVDGYQFVGGSANLTGAVAIGLNGGNEYGGTATLGAAYGLNVYTTVDTGATITSANGVNVVNPTGAGTITNNNGIYVANQTKGTTTNYGLFIQGATTDAIYVVGGATYLGGAETVQTNIYTPSIDGIGATSTIAVGGVNATTINVGTAVATNIAIGNNGISHTIGIGSTSGGATTIEGGTLALGNGASVHTVTLGSTNGASTLSLQSGATGTFILTGPTWTNTTKGIEVGPTGTNATPTLLGINNASTAINAETAANCTTTINSGAIYYSTVTATIRGCVNGAFEDLVTTSGIGAIVFGIVPDTGTTPGDLFSAGTSVNGPCKVSIGSTTSTISWTACSAYTGVSNGTTSNVRKVNVTAGTIVNATTATAGQFSHLCLSNTTGQPVLSTFNATESAFAGTGITTTFSVAAPQLCLADIKFAAGTAPSMIYDTRTYTTSTKQFVNVITTAPVLGGLLTIPTSGGTPGEFVPTSTAGGQIIEGVVVSTTGGITAGTINALMVVDGPVGIKANGTGTVGTILTSSTTGEYVTGATASTTAYANAGVALTSVGTTCAVNSDGCRGSIDTVLNIK